MTVKSCEKLEKSRVALTIETSAEEFEAAVNKAYLKMRGKINVPGFRVGKAPRKIIEKMYGAEVFYEEAVNIILPDAYEAAVKEQELEVVGYPQVELESCTKDGVVFKCTVAVYPEVKLGQYQGLEASDEDVESEMKSVAEKYGMDLDTVKKYLRPEDVKEQVIREKVVKLVADSAVAVAPAEEKAELEAEGEVVEKKAAKKAPAKKPAKKDAEKDAE